jgi:hypothetical protein
MRRRRKKNKKNKKEKVCRLPRRLLSFVMLSSSININCQKSKIQTCIYFTFLKHGTHGGERKSEKAKFHYFLFWYILILILIHTHTTVQRRHTVSGVHTVLTLTRFLQEGGWRASWVLINDKEVLFWRWLVLCSLEL